nr:hypothetical protein [Tanacetum cinerariifolium]
RVIEIDEPAAATDSSGVPSAIEKSPLDFALLPRCRRPKSDPDPLAFADAPSPHPADYNINLSRKVAMGSQLRLRFEQEAKLMRKSVAQVARREQRIQAR